jgi:hypothetical protein
MCVAARAASCISPEVEANQPKQTHADKPKLLIGRLTGIDRTIVHGIGGEACNRLPVIFEPPHWRATI